MSYFGENPYHQEEEEEPCEERSLSLLEASKYDREISPRPRQKKYKIKLMRRPMVMPATIIDFLDQDLRENAIRYVSNFLIEKREEDPVNYKNAGYFLYYSCATMPILLQEVVGFYRKLVAGTANVRSIKRLANVLTLFQSVAANVETRQKFVDSGVPNFLIPVLTFECSVEFFNNIRAISLSVIGILCQHREPKVIKWAIESDIVVVCHTILCTGNELNRVISMHIIEAILQDNSGISYVCNPACDFLLRGLLDIWEELVKFLVMNQDYSPRLLYHILRCYTLLCTHDRGYSIVSVNLPRALSSDLFNQMLEDFPSISKLLSRLRMYLGKVAEIPALDRLGWISHDNPAAQSCSLEVPWKRVATYYGLF